MEGEDILFFEDVFDDDNFDGLLIKNNDDQFCIYVNTQINFKPRHNFTIAHELGHYFLKHELKDGSLICNRYGISENNSEDNDNLEQEANYFAANLLMPINLFYKSYVKIMEKIDRLKFGRMYVDNQPSNYKDWKIMVAYLYWDFEVSVQALRYRLEKLGLLVFNCSQDYWKKSVEDYFSISYKH